MKEFFLKLKKLSIEDNIKVVYTVSSSIYLIIIDLPSYGTVREALPLTYNLLNKTASVQEIEAKIEQSEHFMFTGSKEVSFF